MRDERRLSAPVICPCYDELVTRLLEAAFEAAARLPVERQDALARLLLSEMEAEARWDQLTGASRDALMGLAEEALDEHRLGTTRPFLTASDS